MVLGSALMFMTALNIALGLDIAGGLLVDADPTSTYALHTAAFLLAAPAAFAGVTFFVAVAALGFETSALPRWSAWLAVAGVVANAGAVLGVFTLTGPLNSGNGLLGGTQPLRSACTSCGCAPSACGGFEKTRSISLTARIATAPTGARSHLAVGALSSNAAPSLGLGSRRTG